MLVEAKISDLSAYFPRLSLARCHSEGTAGPSRRAVLGSCLWLDVAGFTALCEGYMRSGAQGTEALSRTLDRFYGGVIESVAASDGDVLFFAGDGALCLWEARAMEDLPQSASRALSAGMCLRDARGLWTEDEAAVPLHQVVVSGELNADTVGGEAGPWIDVLSGPALERLTHLGARCRPGELVVDRCSVDAVGGRERFAFVGHGGFRLRSGVKATLAAGAPRYAEPAVHAPSLLARSPSFLLSHCESSALRPELRRVTIAFSSLESDTTPDLLSLQRWVTTIQRLSSQHGGDVYQVVRDDKGLVALVAFGLPGKARGEEAVRGVRYGRELIAELEAVGLRTGVGVATGTVFCGACGNQQRRQYCVFGSAVNRAARLAQGADRAPLVDEETHAQAKARLGFGAVVEVGLKGVLRPVLAREAGRTKHELAGPSNLVGRAEECLTIHEALVDLARLGRGGVLVIEGELGAGKSALLSRLPVLCAEHDIELVVGFADALESRTGYFALRAVMQRWLSPLLGDGAAALAVELERAGHDPELLALLSPLVPCELASSGLIESMAPDARADTRRRLMADLLTSRLKDTPCVVALEDAHWLDQASSELIDYLRQRLPRVLWILTARSERGDGESIALRLGASRRIVLAGLGPESLEQLLAPLASARTVGPRLTSFVVRAARGNPLHSLEVMRALCATGCVGVEHDIAELSHAGDHEPPSIPGTLEELIQARFDRLSLAARAALRAASVVGQHFDIALLGAVVEPALDAEQLGLALEEARADGLLRARRGSYEFEHASIEAVIRGLLLPSEQKTLHRRTATALQAQHRGNERAVAGRLAAHWIAAGRPEQATAFAALAAEQALESHAHRDAIHFFEQALDCDEQARGWLPVDLQRARWATSLGQALYGASRYDEAQQAYRRAMAWTGLPMPGGGAQLPLSVLRVAAGAAKLALRRSAPDPVSAELRARYAAAMRLIQAWGTIDVWQGRLGSATNKAFAAYRLTQKVADVPEAAEIVSGLGYVLAATPARRFSEHELLRSVALADTATDLQARTSVRVLLGMFYTMVGRTAAAQRPLLDAGELASRLGSGLWRHRACFALAEALFFAGRLDESEAAFVRAAKLAAEAEPPVQGFANSMAAMVAMSAGRDAWARQLLEGEHGVRLVEGRCLALQRFVSVAVHAAALARAGLMHAALERAREAIAMSAVGDDVNVFFAGLHGHTSIVSVLLASLDTRTNPVSSAWTRVQLAAALARLRRFARMYPAARAVTRLLVGRWRARTGSRARARADWREAVRLAVAADQPHYAAEARRLLGSARAERSP